MNEYALRLTAIGMAKLTAAQLEGGERVKIKSFAVGDSKIAPNPSQKKLVSEKWRGEINRVYLDPTEASRIRVEAVIPAEIGGWYIREVGLMDADGDLIAVAKYPETWKPSIDSGTSRETAITFVLQLSDTQLVELVVDPNIVVVTQSVLNRELQLFKEEIYELVDAKDIQITKLNNQMNTLESAIERIMIEFELDQKIRDGYAFFNSLDGIQKGMKIDNRVTYLDQDYTAGMTIENTIEAEAGKTLVIFDDVKSEVFTPTVATGNITLNLVDDTFKKGAVITRSSVKLEGTRNLVPLDYVKSALVSEVL